MSRVLVEMRWVALWRGMNVGKGRRVAMEEVVRAIEGIGGTGVQTYLQSGNAVFCGGRVEGVKELLGLPVVFVEWEEWERMVVECPFEESERLHLMVLRDAGSGVMAAGRSGGDRFVDCGRAIYFELENGVARTKYTNAYVDRVKETVSTMRNWRTVKAIRALG